MFRLNEMKENIMEELGKRICISALQVKHGQ